MCITHGHLQRQSGDIMQSSTLLSGLARRAVCAMHDVPEQPASNVQPKMSQPASNVPQDSFNTQPQNPKLLHLDKVRPFTPPREGTLRSSGAFPPQSALDFCLLASVGSRGGGLQACRRRYNAQSSQSAGMHWEREKRKQRRTSVSNAKA